MTLELFSTSVPAGLEPGRSGFCTVAMTRGLSRPLVEALEALSAYRPVFLPTDPRADDNPVSVSYLRVPAAGRNYHVVSRIGFAGLDYTSRSNRFAHHVVLDAADPRPAGGPAWLAARPGFLEAAFDGQIRYLAKGRAVPAGAAASSACPTWQKLTGDAGWAGVVAEALANPAARSFFLVYDLGADVLTLIREAIGLLPPERRWEATFTTYFTGLPAGVGCTVRGVLRGSAEAAAVQGSSLDLGKLAGKTPPVSEWTAAARAGKAVASRPVAVNAPVKAASPSPLAEPQPLAVLPFADLHEPNAFGFDDGPRLERERKPAGVGKWVVLTVLASLVFLGGGAGAVVMLRPDLFRRAHHVAETGDEKDKVAPVEVEGHKAEPKRPGKFAPSKASLALDRPVAGVPAILRVNLDFPKDAPPFPVEKLRFALDGKELPGKMSADGTFPVTPPEPGQRKIVAEYAGDDRFERVSIPLEVRVLAPLPKFTVEASKDATRGDKIEVRVRGSSSRYGNVGFLAGLACVNGLPKASAPFGPIGLVGQPADAKVTPSPDGKRPILVEGLKPGKYTLKAKFHGDDSYAAGESSNAVEIRVRRRPVLAFEPMSRDDFSRGKLNLRVTVKGSDKDDPIPKGTLQLKSEDAVLADGSLDARGAVAFAKEAPPPGKYDLRLLFTPEDEAEWATAEQPLAGPWQVIPTVVLPIDLEEKDLREKRELAVRFKAASGSSECKQLPSQRRFFLRFRPGPQAVKGAVESHLELVGDTGNPKLVVRWKPGKDSWGMAKPINKTPAFPVITLVVIDTVERPGKPAFDKATKYTLNNAFPPPRGDDFAAYRALVPAFRDVMHALHGAEVEVYEGVDKKEAAKDAKGKEAEMATRVMKDPKSPPLLRLKLLDQR